MLVKFNPKLKENRSFKILKGNILSNKEIKYSKSDVLAEHRTLIRHDSDKLARLIMLLSELKGYQSIVKEIF